MSQFSPPGNPITTQDGSQSIEYDDDVKNLTTTGTIPRKATQALIQVNAAGETFTDPDKAVYYNFCPDNRPNRDFYVGKYLPIGAFILLETREQLEAFRFTTAEAGKVGVLTVEYFE